VLAQYNLGILYSAGRGVAKDEAEAAKWYRLAAEQGYVLAQSSLGLILQNGRGVPRDLIDAYMWLGLASARGDSKAIADRDAVAREMTPVQLAEGQKRVREWKQVIKPPR
jgi:TPR repeat protein